MKTKKKRLPIPYVSFSEHPTTEDESQIQKIMESFVIAYNFRDLKTIEATFHQDARIEVITTGRILRKKEYLEWLKDAIHKVDYFFIDNLTINNKNEYFTIRGSASVLLSNKGFWSVDIILKLLHENNKWHITEMSIPSSRFLLD